jgi:hypothetical protein
VRLSLRTGLSVKEDRSDQRNERGNFRDGSCPLAIVEGLR